MAKTINEVIETHCHKRVSSSRISQLLKGTASHSGVYKAVKRFGETGSCLPKVRSTSERSVGTKNLLKTSEKVETKSR